MLDNDSRRIELMNGNADSLPGTAHHSSTGTKIGMGDKNIYLGDPQNGGSHSHAVGRAGWNGGFSTADPEKACVATHASPGVLLPQAVKRPVTEAVLITRLLSWMKRNRGPGYRNLHRELVGPERAISGTREPHPTHHLSGAYVRQRKKNAFPGGPTPFPHAQACGAISPGQSKQIVGARGPVGKRFPRV